MVKGTGLLFVLVVDSESCWMTYRDISKEGTHATPASRLERYSEVEAGVLSMFQVNRTP